MSEGVVTEDNGFRRVVEFSDYIHVTIHITGAHSGKITYRLGPYRRDWEWHTRGKTREVPVTKEEWELLQHHRKKD